MCELAKTGCRLCFSQIRKLSQKCFEICLRLNNQQAIEFDSPPEFVSKWSALSALLQLSLILTMRVYDCLRKGQKQNTKNTAYRQSETDILPVFPPRKEQSQKL